MNPLSAIHEKANSYHDEIFLRTEKPFCVLGRGIRAFFRVNNSIPFLFYGVWTAFNCSTIQCRHCCENKPSIR